MRRTDPVASAAEPLRVLIAGGGTGGHVVPALAMARALRDGHGATVCLVGTARGVESTLVPAAGFPLELIDVGQLANVSVRVRASTLLNLPRGVRRCIVLLRSFRPHVVVGVGGYASGPAMLAALLLRLPTLVYEPNAAPGMVNRRVGRFVSAAAVAFEETKHIFRNATVTGVPVRAEIFGTGPLPLAAPRLLVTAGSGGAKVFNDALPRIAGELLRTVPSLSIMHQTGERGVADTLAAYRAAGVDENRVQVSAFLPDMPEQLDAATLVLARAGSTIAELCAAGRPSLLVPFPFAADDHQTRNAMAMVRAGAAQWLPQAELNDAVLLSALRQLFSSPETLERMAACARSSARPHALDEIVGLITGLRRA